MDRVLILGIVLLTCLMIASLSTYTLASPITSNINPIHAGANIYRVPLEIKAYQPIVTITKGCNGDLSLSAKVTVKASVNASIARLSLPSPKIFTITESMTLLPIYEERVCIGVIPGLPVHERIVELTGPFGRTIKVEISVTSEVKVKYSLVKPYLY